MTSRLSGAQRTALLRLARESLTCAASRTTLPSPPTEPWMHEEGSVFVSLHRDGHLRGCVGDLTFAMGLGECTIAMSRAAALSDPRFPPVRPEEVPSLQIEISRLSLPTEGMVDSIEIGRHGIVVEHEGRRGLLLPQVAVEFHCSPQEFVDLCCQKAALDPLVLDHDQASLKTFEAEVFGE